ncbi:helix-turn-helix domain-containing protein [Actinoplanes sp. CA-142083]|uniref:TetR/AcrR family transcriptional regulator n=1 Tax=Actinoplanes sp. CA-142083 TaxID=3239903 RepID=UPI003D8AA3A4
MVTATASLLLQTAERLFAERGVHAVSARKIAEEAGQGSNSAVGYHIGTKADLVAAIIRAHAVPMDSTRTRMLARAERSPSARAWISCLVLPVTRHLADLGVPSWYARFAAQVSVDPMLRTVAVTEATSTPAMQRTMDAILSCVPGPASSAAVRAGMVRHLIIHSCADREQDLADGNAPASTTWPRTGALLVDTIATLLEAR